MKTSTDRILTTHTGSLPRPQSLMDIILRREKGDVIDAATFEAATAKAVDEIVAQQVASGVDVVSDAISPGVVKLSCGAWYDPADDSDGAMCRHGNANVLTRDQGTSKLAQGPSSATALVEVERFAGSPPPVGAFVPPLTVS